MNRSELRSPLLDNDFLFLDNCGDSSSGYESGDSSNMPRDPSPIPPRLTRPSDGSHVMVFKNTSDLQDSLAYILSMPELCDVTFLVGKDQVPVHGFKAILATRSRPLYQLVLHHQRQMELEQSRKKKRKSKMAQTLCLQHRLCINITDYQLEDFRRFITFVHSGKVKVDINTVVGLLCASAEFGLRGLHTACTDFIKRCQGLGQMKELIAAARLYQLKKPAQKLLSEVP